MKSAAPGLSLLFVVFTCITACGGGSTSSTPPSSSPPPTGGAPRVAVVVLENLSYSSVIGNASAPYLNQLASQDGLATDYFADTHPSIGNYFMMTTGQIITNDDSFTGTVNADNLAREIVASGKQWRVYAQSLPSAGYTGGDVYPYFRHHNPFSYFTDVLNNPAQAANLVPATQLVADISSGSLPDFAFIVPDAQHDAHDCPTGMLVCTDNDKLSTADSWVQQNVAPLLTSSGFRNGALVIVFDEAAMSDTENVGGHIAVMVAGPATKPGTQVSTTLNHEALLRLVCDRLSLKTCPGAGAGASTAMSDFLQAQP